MSNIAVKRLLNKVKRELLDDKKSQLIRNELNTKKTHKFTMSSEDNVAQIADVLSGRGYPIDDEEVVEIIKQGGSDISNTVWNRIQTEIPANDIYGTPEDFYFLITEGVQVIRSKKGGKRFTKTLSYFDSIKEFYRSEVSKLITKLNRYYKKRDENFEKIQQGRGTSGFLDLGHREGSEVATEQVRRANQSLFKGLTNTKTKAGSLSAKDLDSLGIDLVIIRKGAEEKDLVEVSIESAYTNRNVAEEKEIKAAFLEALERALEKVDLLELEGSDTRVQTERKRVIKRFRKGIKKNPRVKVVTEDDKLKLSKGTPQKTKLDKGKALRGVSKKPSIAVPIRPYKARETKPRNLNLLSLQALINAKLPDKVRENMGPPGLENRSGRFANSVRVTEVTQTNKGFPSLGYSYEKNPYQIFEQGAGKFPWATSERDPRALIDRSIREIAVEYITGRFYTRRI